MAAYPRQLILTFFLPVRVPFKKNKVIYNFSICDHHSREVVLSCQGNKLWWSDNHHKTSLSPSGSHIIVIKFISERIFLRGSLPGRKWVVGALLPWSNFRQQQQAASR